MYAENVPNTKGGDAAFPTPVPKQNHDAAPSHIEQKHTEPVPKRYDGPKPAELENVGTTVSRQSNVATLFLP